MLDQTLWRKGTRFAVTELFVIVAGILVALSIDEWRSDMADNRLEREYLEAIRADLASDLDELELIRSEIKARREAAEILIAIDETNMPRTVAGQVDFVYQIHRAGMLRTFSPSRASIEDLTSTGNLKLIRDRELRKALIDYYNQVEDWKPYAEWARSVIWENYRSEMTGFVPMPLNDLHSNDELPVSPKVMLEVINNTIFQNGIRNARGIAGFQEGAIDRFDNRAKSLIASLDEALGTAGLTASD